MKRRAFLKSLAAAASVAAVTPKSLWETGDERWASVARPGAYIEGETFYLTKAPHFENFPGITIRNCEFVMLEEVDALLHVKRGCEGMTIEGCIFRGPQRDSNGNIRENHLRAGHIHIDTVEEARERHEMHRRITQNAKTVRQSLGKRLAMAQDEQERRAVRDVLEVQGEVEKVLLGESLAA